MLNEVDTRDGIKKEIMGMQLPYRITKEFHEVAERYNLQMNVIEDLFYDIACDSKLDSCKSMEDRLDEASNHLAVVCNKKYKRQEVVTFNDPASQQLYDMISRVLVKQGKLKSDEVLLEFHINDGVHDITDGVFEISSEKVLHFEGFKTAFYKRFHYLPHIVVHSRKEQYKWDYFLTAISEHKQEIIESLEDSDLVNEAKFVLEELFKLQITSTEGEHAATGKKIFEQSGVYYVTAARIKEIYESLNCKYSQGKIGNALVELGVKNVGCENKHLGNASPRCWQFHKDIFEQIRKGGFLGSK